MNPSSRPPVAVVWFRNDLRLADNPALAAAVDAGYAVVPVYVHAPEEEGAGAPGAASDAWRTRSLQQLAGSLARRGTPLRIFKGPALATLRAVVASTGASAMFWNRRYEPAVEARDARVKLALREDGLTVRSFNGSLMVEPWSVETGQGTPYRVFTPYWRSARPRWRECEPWHVPDRLLACDEGPSGIPVAALGLQPSPRWDRTFWDAWNPGEAGAHEALEIFLEGTLDGYADGRDRPAQTSTSRLSPHLHFGEIAPWRIHAAVHAARSTARERHVDTFAKELGWREFAHHLLHHFPETVSANFNKRFDGFPWQTPSSEQWRRVEEGRTGIPLVDAGLRELWHTGWMHNRVRMVVGSCLTKHLRWHWQHGARWFWDTLVDADLANNTLGWQWVAGTGADAAPYFRIFNPATQAARFDPDGIYIARWVPELAGIPAKARFAPWQHPDLLDERSRTYPAPLVSLAEGREAALAALAASARRNRPSRS